MKKHLAVLAGAAALGVAALLAVVSSRTTASAPPAKADGGDPKVAPSRISHVTVYPDSALVTREVEVPAGAGLMELVVSPLPEATVTSSLYTESTEAVRVLTTRFRTRPVREDTREEVRKLEEEIRKHQLDQRRLQAETKALNDNLGLMVKLESFTSASTVHATEKGKLDSESAIQLAKYLMDGRMEKVKQLTALGEQTMSVAENLEYAQRKLRELTSGVSRVERDAVLVIDKPGAGAGKVKLNYLVAAASWRPQYKFRAGKTAKDAVAVEYLAAVMQQTGEDWERVSVTRSTAQPMLNASPPELHALAVAVAPRGMAPVGVTVGGLQAGLGNTSYGPSQGGFQGGFQAGGTSAPAPAPAAEAARIPGGGGFQLGGGIGGMGGAPGEPPAQTLALNRLSLANPGAAGRAEEFAEASKKLREQSQRAANLKATKDADELANYAGVLDQVRDLVVMQQKAAPGSSPKVSEGPSVTYHLASRLSVPSRNDEQVIEVTRLDFEPEYYYKAVPVLSPHVYRQATIVNKSKHVLLPGEATMYNGSDFVGRMTLPLVAVGEEFTAGFGAEPQLQVTRLLLDKNRAMQAGNQILKYEYRILVSSYKAEKVRVQVWDRMPHAEKEAMNVTMVKASPELSKDALYVREERANNLLRWDLDVEPEMRGEKAKKVQYEFQLELDRQATLGTFGTK